MKGIIKIFNREKGFGFITDVQGKDIYFHISQVKDTEVVLEEGLEVEFDVKNTSKGTNAINVNIKNMSIYSRFIAFQDVRIKISNIKNYGIKNDSIDFFKKIEQSKTYISNYEDKIKECDLYIERLNKEIVELGGNPEDYENDIEVINSEYIILSDYTISKKNLYTGKYPSCYSKEEILNGILKDRNCALIVKRKNLLLKEDCISNKNGYEAQIEYKLAKNNKLEYLYITTYQNDNFKFYAHMCDFDIRDKIHEMDKLLL